MARTFVSSSGSKIEGRRKRLASFRIDIETEVVDRATSRQKLADPDGYKDLHLGDTLYLRK